jgi:hypothetical protein
MTAEIRQSVPTATAKIHAVYPEAQPGAYFGAAPAACGAPATLDPSRQDAWDASLPAACRSCVRAVRARATRQGEDRAAGSPVKPAQVRDALTAWGLHRPDRYQRITWTWEDIFVWLTDDATVSDRELVYGALTATFHPHRHVFPPGGYAVRLLRRALCAGSGRQWSITLPNMHRTCPDCRRSPNDMGYYGDADNVPLLTVPAHSRPR